MKISLYSEIQSRPGKPAAQPTFSISAQELFASIASTVMPHFAVSEREAVGAAT